MSMLLKVAIQCLIAFLTEKKISLFEREYSGKGKKLIKHRSLTINNRALADFDSWLHYLKGNFDLVGPAPIPQNKAIALGHRLGNRLNVAPGLIHPYSVKLRSGIAHQDEVQTSSQFAEEVTDGRRLQLLATHLVQKLLGSRFQQKTYADSFNLFGVTLNTVTMKDAVNRVAACVQKDKKSRQKFAFVNADCANKYYKNSEYRNTLNRFDAVFPDGVGVRIAANWLKNQPTSNVNGTDMFPLLCEQLQAQGSSLFLLGARPEVIERVAKKLANDYPNLRIAGFHDGYSIKKCEQEVIAKINSSNTDLLLVAMGAPHQEQWIEKNIASLDVGAAMGVGGLFDFYSGEVSRAPEFLRELSLEWVWRLAVQPLDKGFRYLIGNPLFLLRIMKTHLGSLLSKPSRAPVSIKQTSY